MNYYFLVAIAFMTLAAPILGLIAHKKRMFRKAQEEFAQEISDALHYHNCEMEEAISQYIDGGGGWL